MGVGAFDDHVILQLHLPPITAIAQPVEDMSRQVINLLLKRVSGAGIEQENETVILPATRIIRDSSIRNNSSGLLTKAAS
jgi:LacI family transcriptional regulator